MPATGGTKEMLPEQPYHAQKQRFFGETKGSSLEEPTSNAGIFLFFILLRMTRARGQTEVL